MTLRFIRRRALRAIVVMALYVLGLSGAGSAVLPASAAAASVATVGLDSLVGATGVTWNVTFQAPFALGSGDVIQISQSQSGFTSSPADYTITPTGGIGAAPSAVSVGSGAVTLTVANATPAGATVAVQMRDVTNPSSVGYYTLTILVGAFPACLLGKCTYLQERTLTSDRFGITDFGGLQYSFSTLAPLATATWSVSFTAAQTWSGKPGGDSVLLQAPAGTVFPLCGPPSAFVGKTVACPPPAGITSNLGQINSICFCAALAEAMPNQMTINFAGQIAAGKTVTIQLQGVQNPPAGAYPPNDLAVEVDAVPFAQSQQGTTFDAYSVQPSSLLGRGTAVWTYTFTALAPLQAGSQVLAVSGAVAMPPSLYAYTVQDETTGASIPVSGVQVVGVQASLALAAPINAGDQVQVTVSPARNDPSGTYPAGDFAVTAEAPPGFVATPPQGFQLVNRQQGITAATTSTIEGAPGTTWTVNFPTETDLGGGATIFVAGAVAGAPAGADEVWSPLTADYSVSVSGAPGGPFTPAFVHPLTVGGSGPGVLLQLPRGFSALAGQAVTVVARDVTNPAAPGSLSVTVLTLSGPQGTRTPSGTASVGLVFSPQGGVAGSAQVHLQQAVPLPVSTLPSYSVPTSTPPYTTQAPATLEVARTHMALTAGSPTTFPGNQSAFVVQGPSVTLPLDFSYCINCGWTTDYTVTATDTSTGATLGTVSWKTGSGLPEPPLDFALDGLAADVQFNTSWTCTPYCPQTVTDPLGHTFVVQVVKGTAQTSMSYQVVQTPTAVEQLDVLPFKILYAPPGDESSASFALQASQSSSTSYSLGSSLSNTQSTSSDVTLSEEADASVEGVTTKASASQSWQSGESTTATQASATATGVTFTSSEGETWTSAAVGTKLDQPGVQPWMFDEFVLIPHPQFAIYDNVTCANGQAPPCTGGTTGSVSYAMIGAGTTQVDVTAAQLLGCAEGVPLAIPGTYIPPLVLPPSECASLLAQDPFAPSDGQPGSQAADPSTRIGAAAVSVQTVDAGQPGQGTPGAFTVTLTNSETQSIGSSSSQSFSATVDSAFTTSEAVSVGATFSLFGSSSSVTAGASYKQTQSTSVTQSVTVQTDSSQASTITVSASATLKDGKNPLATHVWLDGRWGTLMFQVANAAISGVVPVSGGPGTQIDIGGSGFWNGAVGVQFCPAGSGGCVPAVATDPVSDTQLLATVPNLPPGQYTVQVLDPGGLSQTTCASGSVGCDQFTVVAPVTGNAPAVTSVTPATSTDAGGAAVTLTGANLGGVTQVWFGESNPPADAGAYQAFLQSGAPGLPLVAPAPSFRILSDSAIAACTPAVAQPGTVWVAVYSDTVGWSAAVPGDQFLYTAGASQGPCDLAEAQGPPTVTSVSPATGPANGGTTVTVLGSGFQPQEVAVACTAAGCPPGGTATLLPPPSVEFCAPAGAPCTAATNVVATSESALTAQVPPGVGLVDVRVGTTAGFSAVSATDQYNYIEPVPCFSDCLGPGILALGATPPDAVALLEPATLTAEVLNGVGQPLAGAAVQIQTDFGQLSVTQSVYGTVYTNTQGIATVILASPAPGVATVSATVYGTPTVTNHTQVTFDPVPIVTGLGAHHGSPAGGEPLTITGTGFVGATAVYFGYVAVSSQDFVTATPTSITLRVPPEAGASTGDVVVANPAAESGLSPADRFTYGSVASIGSGGGSGSAPGVPAVTGLGPAFGPATGGTSVAISGSNLSGATAVYFGGSPAQSFTIQAEGTIEASAPAGAGLVYVTVAGPGGTSPAVAAGGFSYLPLPRVTDVTPGNGPLTTFTPVTIGGTGFTTVAAVYFGRVAAASFTVVSDFKIDATAPPAALSGPVDVTVAAACEAAATACGMSLPDVADTFTYLPPPVVTGLNPANGSTEGGEPVTISGTGFATATEVLFGATPAQSYQVSSDSEILALAPQDTTGGRVPISVVTSCDTANTADATSCGQSAVTPAGTFTFGGVPVVAALSPSSGPLAGDVTVTISGSGFGSLSGVAFGTVPATVLSHTATSITVTSPMEIAAGPLAVTVTAACGVAGASSCGTSTASAGSTFDILPLPVITSISPPDGTTAAGGQVTLAGTGLQSATAVEFGDTAGTIISATDTAVVVSIPTAAQPGAVDVTVTTSCVSPGATSCGSSAPATFTYYPTTAGSVIRTLQPGWNTLSIPFPLAATAAGAPASLCTILSDGGASLQAAYAFADGHWREVRPCDPGAVGEPLAGLYLYIGGTSDVTATLTPGPAPAGAASLPTAPDLPPSVDLNRGWNLVGPSAPLGSESYGAFLTGPAAQAIALLIDPNGGDVAVPNPQGDSSGQVSNGFGYWLYASQDGQSLVGQILTGPAAGGPAGRGHGH